MPVRMNDEAAGSENKTGRGEELHRNPSRDYLDLNDVPFPYKDLSGMEHRIVYYETSRGCPFACSYCLSSVHRKVRLRDMSLVEKELQFFLDHHVPQVKFVDRTFNCNPAHTRAIWEYIREHDNGVTNFHFEIAAELLREEELELLASFRPGLVQLEIGIQTVNPDTLTAICRKADMVKLSAIVRRLLLAGNMHIHLDLIAGLPYEDLASFRNSFKAVYDLHPEQLQLGFLKVLKGSPMERQSAEYGIIYKEQPPYEVLSTRWLSYGDILELKQVEEMLETYYNSGQFLLTMRYLEHFYENPYDLYRELALFYEKEGLFDRKLNRYDRYESLRRFWLESRCAGVSDREDGSFCAGTDNAGEDNASRRQNGDESEIIDTLLLHDLYARENVKSRPAYGRSGEVPKEEYREFFESGRYEKWLPDYAGMKPAQVSRMVHLEKVEIDPFQTAKAGKRVEWKGYLLYDYQSIHAIIRNARCVPIAEQMKQMNETPDGRKR